MTSTRPPKRPLSISAFKDGQGTKADRAKFKKSSSRMIGQLSEFAINVGNFTRLLEGMGFTVDHDQDLGTVLASLEPDPRAAVVLDLWNGIEATMTRLRRLQDAPTQAGRLAAADRTSDNLTVKQKLRLRRWHELRAQHGDDGAALDALAVEVGSSPQAVRQMLKRAGIQVSTRSRQGKRRA